MVEGLVGQVALVCLAAGVRLEWEMGRLYSVDEAKGSSLTYAEWLSCVEIGGVERAVGWRVVETVRNDVISQTNVFATLVRSRYRSRYGWWWCSRCQGPWCWGLVPM